MVSGDTVDRRHSPAAPRWRGHHHRWRTPVGFCWMLMVASLMLVVTAAESGDGAAGFLLRSTLDRLERRGEILFDPRTPPAPANAHLQRRQLFSSPTPSPSSTSSAESTSSMSASSSSASPSSTSSVVTDPESGNGSPLPTVFDTSLGANFTSNACPDFFRQFLANNEFRNCLPFSLLLQVEQTSIRSSS